MSDRRQGPPLFELLSGEQGESTKGLGGTDAPELGSKPRMQVELRPMEQTSEDAPAPRDDDHAPPGTVTSAERAAALSEDHADPSQSAIRLTMPRLYLSIAVVLLMMTGVWAAAYNIGVEEGKAQMESLIDDPASIVVPRRQPDPPAGGGRADAQPPVESPARTGSGVPAPEGPGASPRGGVLVAGGDVVPDPREQGTNYLKLGTLDASQARDALAFFAASGVRLIAAPLDSGAGSGNNPARFTLYSVELGVPSGRYRAMSSERDAHQRRIADIGSRWQRERRGGSDFAQSKTLWVKYE